MSVPSGLWPHQDEAAELAVKLLASGGRAQLHMACGTGKTAVAAAVARAVAPAGRVLVLAPTVMLLTQILAEFRRVTGDAGTGRALVVCSGSQMGASARAAVEELDARHVEVTSDPGRIAAIAAGSGRVTVVATYASQRTLALAHAERGLPPWDLVVADEAHRAAGATGRPWSRVHQDEQIPARRRLYMTATPRVLISGGDTAADVAGMDDESVFGPVASRLGFASAIELGLLASYRLVVSLVSDAEVQALAAAGADGMVRHGRYPVPAQMLAAQIAVLRAAREFGLRRAISYHTRIGSAREFAATLNTAAELLPASERPATVWAGEVHGGQTLLQRQLRLARLSGEAAEDFTLVSNARLLSEGVDLPAVDAVVFADPRGSVTDTIQAIGRALRLGGDRTKTATIIVPLLSDPGQDPAAVLAASAWAPVWQVVRALRAHDDTLAAVLDARRRAAGTRADSSPWEPDWLHVHGTALPDGFASAITVHLVREATPDWEEYYGAAAAYRDEHGHLLVPGSWTTPGGLGLGNWIHNQRTARSRGKLGADRISRLDALGMTWNTTGIAWAQALVRAAAFRDQHGHLDIPSGFTCADGFALGAWLAIQRAQHRDQTLDPARRRKLADLGIDWAPLETAWDKGLAAARAYHAEHGHLNVRQAGTFDGFPLGTWITRQRSEYRDGSLDPDRRRKLEALGLDWAPLDAAWEKGLAAARAYRAEHGHLDVPDNCTTPDGFNLGTWLAARRRGHRKGTLPADRARQLEQAGICWNPRAAAKEHAFAAARAYAAQHGHLRVPVAYTTSDGFTLGQWLSRQRARAGRLPETDAAILRSLDPDWSQGRHSVPPHSPDPGSPHRQRVAPDRRTNTP